MFSKQIFVYIATPDKTYVCNPLQDFATKKFNGLYFLDEI